MPPCLRPVLTVIAILCVSASSHANPDLQSLADPGPAHASRGLSLRLGLGPAVLGAHDGPGGQGPARVMATGELLLDIPLSTLLGLEILGRSGVTPSRDGTSLLGLGLGLRAATALGWGFEGQLMARVHHIHEAPNSAWLEHTGPTLAGDPSYGLAHLTAAGGGAGVAWAIPGMDGRLLMTLEVEVLGLIHGHGSRPLPRIWFLAPVGVRWHL